VVAQKRSRNFQNVTHSSARRFSPFAAGTVAETQRFARKPVGDKRFEPIGCLPTRLNFLVFSDRA
jgi:hypothetical protein